MALTRWNPADIARNSHPPLPLFNQTFVYHSHPAASMEVEEGEMFPKLLSLPALFTLAVVPLLAQADDPPSRVARINYLSGSVSFRPGSLEEWTAATLN